jgi:hypothetical protein
MSMSLASHSGLGLRPSVHTMKSQKKRILVQFFLDTSTVLDVVLDYAVIRIFPMRSGRPRFAAERKLI